MSLKAVTPALALLRVDPSVLTTFRIPPYERYELPDIQYSYCLSVDSGFPKFPDTQLVTNLNWFVYRTELERTSDTTNVVDYVVNSSHR